MSRLSLFPYPATRLLAGVAVVVVLGGWGKSDPCCDCWCERTEQKNSSNSTGPLVFEANLGQADARYRYLARAYGMQIFLDAAGSAWFDLRSPGRDPLAVIELSYAGASKTPRLEPVGDGAPDTVAPGHVNYFLGSDSSRWLTDIPATSQLTYRGIYPGIDVTYYGSAGELEHDLIVNPGADPRQIRLQFKGAERAHLRDDGSLLLEANGQEVVWRKPSLYQRIHRRNRKVEGRYRLERDGTIGFEVGVYDPAKKLVIDPVVSFSTYLGRSNPDLAGRVTTDSAGNVYMSGVSFDALYPVTPGAPTSQPGGARVGSAIITKLNPAGTSIVFSAYLGGINTDGGVGVAVDGAGNIYIAGSSDSPDYPTTSGAFQTRNNSRNMPTPGRYDCVLTKINSAGNALSYSTFLGGPEQDSCLGVAVDASGSAYVAGFTNSTGLPTTEGAFQPNYIGGSSQAFVIQESDGFVARFSPDGSRLLYLTYLGGTGDDGVTSIAVDSQGAAYVTGFTTSQLRFPATSGAAQTRMNGAGGQGLLTLGDAFVTKLAPDGKSVVYSTYLGGLRDDIGMAIALDGQGNAYVTGSTLSTDFPVTAQAYQRAYRGAGGENSWVAGDVFCTKVNPQGTAFVWSTYLGGTQDDRGVGIAVDAAGNAYIAGNTLSRDFPTTTDAAARTFKGTQVSPDLFLTGDAFLTQLNASGSALVYSTFLGGAGNDWATGVALDPAGAAVVTGGTSSRDFPVTNGTVQGMYGGSPDLFLPTGDAFLTRFAPDGAQPGSGSVSISSLSSAASYVGGSIAPGEIVVLTGASIGPAPLTTLALTPANTVATTLGETRVLFDEVPAPLLYVSAGQTSAIVPYEMAGRASARVVVEYRGNRSAAITAPVVAAKPALFSANASGRGPGAIQNEDFSLNTADNPSPRGRVVILYGTGEGQTNPPGVSGRLATAVFPKPVLPVSVTIGGRTADVLYAGAAPSLVAGLFQINAKIPEDLSPGAQEVTVTVGAARSQAGLTVAVR